MKKQLKKYLEEFVSMLKQGGDIALQELPKFINEYLTYYTYYHGVIMTLGLLGIIIGVYAYVKANRHMGWEEEFAGFMIIPAIIVVVPSSFLFFHNLFAFIKVTIAPRLYLVENLMELVS